MTAARGLVVAIDGPAGSGKSTVAAALAERLGVAHIDTGAFYRAATLLVLRAGVNIEDGPACARLVEGVTITRRGGRTHLEDEDVEDAVRGPEVTAAVSTVSAHPQVRAALLQLQRHEVDEHGAVVEGRDAGTVVVPHAPLKVWLTASPTERATRRAGQLGRTDADAVAAHAADIRRRDAADAGQMKRAPGAVEIDTTGRAIDELVDELVERTRSVERPSPTETTEDPP